MPHTCGWQVGVGCQLQASPQGCSGVLTAWQPRPPEGVIERAQEGSCDASHVLILEVTHRHLCCLLFITSEPLNAAHTQEVGVYVPSFEGRSIEELVYVF